MNVPKTGDIVFSTAGHDRDRAYIVVRADGRYARLADGKTKKLDGPKKKSLKHLKFAKPGTNELSAAVSENRATDSMIRKALAKFRGESDIAEEGESNCQKMM